jgi:hypothetical protein
MRDEFSKKTIDTLARRTGMRCSNPSCRQPTSGPAEDPTGTINVGVAAHITAAASGGPRYDFSMTREQRVHIDNALWLCQKCAKLIDSDSSRFDLGTLFSWKASAEETAIVELEKGSHTITTQSINAAVVIQGEGAIQIKGNNAVNIGPGGITIVGSVINKPNPDNNDN